MKRPPTVPAQPFIDWLAERYEYWDKQERASGTVMCMRKQLGPAARVAQEIGWGADSNGIRKLFRYRRGLRSTSVVERNACIKGDVPTDAFPRRTIEDALDHAGVPFDSLYPGLLVDPPPIEKWCETHQQMVFVDLEGECQWCAGEREFRQELLRRKASRRGYVKRRAMLETELRDAA